jgi:sortase (surface protein transpeptidase)
VGWLGARSRRERVGIGAVGAALVATGLVIASSSNTGVLHSAAHPPTPPSPVSVNSSTAPPQLSLTPSGTISPSPSGPHPTCKAASGGQSAPSSQASAPVRICVPAIGVNASVIEVGLNADHTVQVPTLSQVREAGWYRYSPEPGADGPTIILGHVDSAQYGNGVFFNLGRLRAGDLVDVSRSDGSVATFRISDVAQYPKTAFPTDKVYGNTFGPTIRLITCGGRFDASTRNYLDNIVAYGELTSVS